MRLFVTGARGFVMSVFIRRFLDAHPNSTVTAVDIAEPDDLLLRSLAEARSRVEFRTMDVRDERGVAEAIDHAAPEVIVHGATLTHVPEWEAADPSRFIDVNVMGTTRVLDAARRTPSVRKAVLVSSAAVYGAGSGSTEPQPEDSPLDPDEMYGVSKVAGELIAHRFSALYELDVPIVRFTKVFGPMERPSSSRSAMSLPFHLARALVNGRQLTVTERTLHAVGDWISAVDLADALVTLSTADNAGARTYNLATGELTPARDLIDLFGTSIETTPSANGDSFDMDPDLRSGKNGTYSIERAIEDLNWRPRDLRAQVSEYVDWAKANPECFQASN